MRYVQTSDETFVRHIHNEVENIQWNATTKTTVRKLSEAQRVEFGISRLQMVTSPYFDQATQTRADGDAVLVGDVWTQNWIITDLSGDDLSGATDVAERASRSERDALLAATDWTASTDVTMTAEMTTYRQALRDVPAQAGFPSTIAWPTSP
tara:strand:- start:88 stop:543 length:456 start_codon:yes stop_codon:yes gene_type:complete